MDEVWWCGAESLIFFTSFSSRDFSWSNKHDTFWYVASTGYFYVLFIWAIAVSDFRSFEIYKSVGLPLSAITFTVNSHAYNHFCKYIYLFQILYSMKYYTVWAFVFCIQNWFKCETPLIFSNKKHGLKKKILYRKKSFFTVDYIKIIELHNVHTWRHIQSE